MYWEDKEWKFPDDGDGATSETFPGDSASILIHDPVDGFALVEAHYGLVPPWCDDVKWSQRNTYNARSETIFERTSYKAAILKSRCVVPISGYYEQCNKRWVRVAGVDGRLLLGGIYVEPNRVCPIRSFAVVTTDPNEVIAPIQDRMPLILDQAGMGTWLNPNTTKAQLIELFRPCPNEWLVIEDAGSTSRRKPTPQGKFSFLDED
jgi:putative SOS response-associated peptidase YedK